MNSLIRLPNRRLGYASAAFALVIATVIAPLASAAQVTERSIQLGSSAAGATGVTYKVNFTAVGAADAFVVDFCTNTPLVGETCTAPAGLSVASATTPTAGATVDEPTDASDNNTLRVTTDITASEEVEVELAGINNPTAAGNLFARIVTYDTEANANLYTSDGVVMGSGGAIDQGGVAMSITPTIAVSGAVLESMTFCVSAAEPTASCGGITAPQLKLGRVVDDITVLDADDVYEGILYAQLSTNAAGGAIVNLKSNTTGCGGLSRVGAADFAAGCGILPANQTNGFDITAGQAKFGVKTGTAAGVGTFTGTLRAFDEAGGSAGTPYYNNTAFKLNYVNGTEGITSTYGDPFLDTNGAPVSNMNMPVTFGASANSTTTAGRYTADLSMIATGKF